MIEREIDYENARKFIPYLRTLRTNVILTDTIDTLIFGIDDCYNSKFSTLELDMSVTDFDLMMSQLVNLNKGSIQMVSESVQGDWESFMEELEDEVYVPF
ncbi:hypothetical protein NIES4071_75810 [Calothrix sp. NIES-4071]|nr:hypothetical protein NIES4071_75810 [Calothrix sp. NIES-4071]BAZ61856.1 hypothetical protein NIES4105_75760 [Calothrix sp. NIES-4105]